MSLSQKIAAAVADLVEHPTTPTSIQIEDQGLNLTLSIQLASTVGVECGGVDFQVAEGVAMSLDDLKRWGTRIASRLTYLMEPLAVLEADPIANRVVLRSQAPTSRKGRRGYYEIRLSDAGHLNLVRIAYDESERKKSQVACQFTTEVLERLVDDLVATAA